GPSIVPRPAARGIRRRMEPVRRIRRALRSPAALRCPRIGEADMTSSDEQHAARVPDEERTARHAAQAASETVVKHATLMLRAYRSESAIYGVVLVSSLIAIGWREDTDLQVLVFTLGAVVVFWLAH